MNKDSKERFWEILSEPVFDIYICSTCKHAGATGDCKGKEVGDRRHHTCNKVPYTSRGKWDWDGISLPSNFTI